MRKTTSRVGAALIAVTAGAALVPGTSNADPAGHQVTYRVTTTSGLQAQIYYIATEPPSKSAFDADSSKYLINVRVPVDAGAPWTYQTTMNDPGQWAIVTASGGLRVNPEFHCEIVVDGTIVVQQDGGSGVKCSTRPW